MKILAALEKERQQQRPILDKRISDYERLLEK